MKSVTEIKNKIRSVKDTANITRAMQLISVAKLNRAEDKYRKNKSYALGVEDATAYVVERLGKGFKHKYLSNTGCERVAYLVIAANTGMAGDYNHRVLNLALNCIKNTKMPYIFIIGQVAGEFFQSVGIVPDVEYMYCADDPGQSDAEKVAGDLLGLFEGGFIDEVRIIHTLPGMQVGKAENTLLLPLAVENVKKSPHNGLELELEPNAEVVFEGLVKQYVVSKIYSALVESIRCEHTERISAMSSATKNAEEMIDDLNLQYFRARQDKITTELAEIAGGNEVK